MITRVNPKSIASIDRLDIALKVLYISEYMMGEKGKYYNLYKQHIELRTGNVEDHKSKSEDFINDFNSLIDSMKNKGFDDKYPVEISIVNGINLSGAHRLACALYFDVKEIPVFYSSNPGLKWGSEWFVTHFFDISIIEELELTILRFIETTTFIIWNPLFDKFSEISDVITDKYDLLVCKDINFNKSQQLIEAVNDIYSYELGPSVSSIIEDKAYRLSTYPSLTFRVVIIRNISEEDTLSLKLSIREMYKELVDVNSFLSLHSSDDQEHSKYLNSLLLSKSNLDVLQSRSTPSIKLREWLDELYNYCNVNHIKRHDLCIVGSSTMDVLGIRDSTDIDFILKHSIREEKFTSMVHKLTDNVDLACEGYLRLASKNVSDDTIIFNEKHHFYYRGFKFISLYDVLSRKKIQCRDKDISDVKLIEVWSKKIENPFVSVINKFKFKIWFFFIAKPRFYKLRIKNKLRKILPPIFIRALKRVVK